MKRSTKFKIASFVSLGVVLIGFNQCVVNKNLTNKPTSPQVSSNLTTGSTTNSTVTNVLDQASLNQFKLTVWPITTNHCAGCHATGQTPYHASSNAQTAFDSVMTANKVDLTNPINSRMYLKLKNESHYCWKDCASSATEMLNAIETWKSALGADVATDIAGVTTNSTSTIYDALNPTAATDSGTITLMAEAASLKAPMVLNNSMGVSYVWVPTTTIVKTLSNADAGTATLNFNIIDSDFYHVYMYVNAPADTSDSVFVKVAGSDYKEWFIGTTANYAWKELTNTSAKLDTEFYLNAGNDYKLEIRQKESGLMISKVILTNDPTYDPTALAPAKLTKATLSIPLSKTIGVDNSFFEIDVEEFDTYSYKVSNPRIKSSKPVVVKDLKLLVNGKYNPQHATYTNVNKTITAADPIVSTASMIVLKDKSISEDVFSFNFEVLSAVK